MKTMKEESEEYQAWNKDAEKIYPLDRKSYEYGYRAGKKVKETGTFNKATELNRINFWKRLEMFVENVQINDPMSEEEKEMILRISKEYQGIGEVEGKAEATALDDILNELDKNWIVGSSGSEYRKVLKNAFKEYAELYHQAKMKNYDNSRV